MNIPRNSNTLSEGNIKLQKDLEPRQCGLAHQLYSSSTWCTNGSLANIWAVYSSWSWRWNESNNNIPFASVLYESKVIMSINILWGLYTPVQMFLLLKFLSPSLLIKEELLVMKKTSFGLLFSNVIGFLVLYIFYQKF